MQNKKRILNIRPQEVTIDGERSVQYKGSDGKMHEVASAAQGQNLPSGQTVIFMDKTGTGGSKSIRLFDGSELVDGSLNFDKAIEIISKDIFRPVGLVMLSNEIYFANLTQTIDESYYKEGDTMQYHRHLPGRFTAFALDINKVYIIKLDFSTKSWTIIGKTFTTS